MRTIIAGPRDCNDYELLKKAIEKSGFEITEVVSGAAKGVDSLGERWAKENGVPVKQFPALWNDFSHPDTDIKINNWGKRYNKNAGKIRNQEMAEYGEALIAIDLGTPGTSHMISSMKKMDKPVYKYDPHEEIEDDEVGYEF